MEQQNYLRRKKLNRVLLGYLICVFIGVFGIGFSILFIPQASSLVGEQLCPGEFSRDLSKRPDRRTRLNSAEIGFYCDGESIRGKMVAVGMLGGTVGLSLLWTLYVPILLRRRNGAGRGALLKHWPVLLLLSASALGAVVFVTNFLPLTGSSDGTDWDGRQSFVCDGNRIVELKNKNIDFRLGYPAIMAKDRCSLTLTDCNIKAGPALWIGDDAEVTVQGGTLEGTSDKPAVLILDSASLTLNQVVIKSPSDAIIANENAQVHLNGGSVTADQYALRMRGTTSAYVRGTAIEGEVRQREQAEVILDKDTPP